MMNRPCCRVVCPRQATYTLTFDYEEQLAVIGPLGYVAEPHTYDLCGVHAERLKAPQGWEIMRPVPLGHDS